MAQHDLDVANGSGSTVRADINSALQALGSGMKGPNAPSGAGAGWKWIEDDNPSSTVWTARRYDGADWIVEGYYDTTNNTFTPARMQDGSAVWAGTTGGTSTAITATLAPALTAYTTGMAVHAKIGTACGNAPTLNINSVGAKKLYIATLTSIAQATTGDLVAGDLATFRYDAALDGGSGGWVITSAPVAGERVIYSTTVSGASNVNLPMPTAFRRYRLDVSDVILSTAGAEARLRFSSDAGSTYLTASNYITLAEYVDGAGTVAGFANVSSPVGYAQIGPALPGSTAHAWNGEYWITPGSGSFAAQFSGRGFGINSSSVWVSGIWSGSWTGTSARMDYVRILASTGTLSGTFSIIGLR